MNEIIATIRGTGNTYSKDNNILICDDENGNNLFSVLLPEKIMNILVKDLYYGEYDGG